MSDDIHCRLLKMLVDRPDATQRELAEALRISVGKSNYCLSALMEKGLVRLGDFGKNLNKRQYAYLLTQAGIEEKTRITRAFLKRKEAEFEAIRREIETLRGELEPADSNRPKPVVLQRAGRES